MFGFPSVENIGNVGSVLVCETLKLPLVLRPGGISVHYALHFEVNSLKSSSESPEAVTELPEPSVVSRLQEMVTKALQEEASLPIDLDTLRFDPGRRRRSLSGEPAPWKREAFPAGGTSDCLQQRPRLTPGQHQPPQQNHPMRSEGPHSQRFPVNGSEM